MTACSLTLLVDAVPRILLSRSSKLAMDRYLVKITPPSLQIKKGKG
jgi:hypothetical protein